MALLSSPAFNKGQQRIAKSVTQIAGAILAPILSAAVAGVMQQGEKMDKIYNELFSQSFPSDEQLVEFALKRHGYCMDNGYYGVTYPDDLDEYEREVEGQSIPEGMLRINYWDGLEKERIVSEQDYLSALRGYLLRKGNKYLARCLAAA